MLKWFESYLINRKQYVQMNKKTKTDFQDVTCRVTQGSMLDSLLFLIYANDLQYILNVLEPIMFANDTIYFMQKGM